MNMYWPIALIVVCNVFYHICAKSLPEGIDPFASLTITYAVGAVVSGICFIISSHGTDLAQGYSGLNWTPFILGVAVVGLEVGSIYMYKVGWNINTGFMFESIILSIALIIVGFLLYKEAITWNKVTGIAICLVGIYFLNK